MWVRDARGFVTWSARAPFHITNEARELVKLSCACLAFALRSPCVRLVFALPLPCCWLAFALCLRCCCLAFALLLTCVCRHITNSRAPWAWPRANATWQSVFEAFGRPSVRTCICEFGGGHVPMNLLICIWNVRTSERPNVYLCIWGTARTGTTCKSVFEAFGRPNVRTSRVHGLHSRC